MPDTISTERRPTTACAVFKIDLKGRFVYIDDETEELFGLSREELFGKSLYDFITSDTHRLIDAVLQRHSRYELFFESVPLMIQTEDGVRQLDAVITVNFISGNPVNHQFILKLSQTSAIQPETSWERMLLELLGADPDDIDFNRLAEIWSAASGYSAAECYVPEKRDSLKMVGSYPYDNPGHTAPAYLQTYREAGEDRFSYRPGDVSRHDGFGDGRSEALIFLQHEGGKNLVVRLTGPEDYHPSEPQINNIDICTHLWNKNAEQIDRKNSPGKNLDIIGQAGNALGLGIAAVTDDFAVIYANDCFFRHAGELDPEEFDRDIRAIVETWQIHDLQSRPLTFEKSPFAEVVENQRAYAGHVVIPESDQTLTVLAAPLKMDGSTLYLYCLIGRAAPATAPLPGPGSNGFELLSLVHDIRAPLISIEAFTRRLREKYADQLDDDGTFIVDSIIENSKILQAMITGLNELSKNQDDDEAPQDVYLKQLIKELMQELKAAYPGTHYRVKCSGGLPCIRGPKRKLTTVFRNILDNAFKYTATIPEPAIDIDYSLEAGQHRFLISDNGPGVDPDYSEKIFTPFFRTPEAAAQPGSGIGLALAKDILTACGGKIWVEKPEQQGMRIAFTLPPDIPRWRHEKKHAHSSG